MIAGQIVLVDWRDALPNSGEPNKRRPGIIIGSDRFFENALPFELVVPLTGKHELAIAGASLAIDPSPENGCTKRCFALAWNVQTVPHQRVTATPSHLSANDLARLRSTVAACIGVSGT